MPCMEEAWPSQGRGFLLTSSHSRVGPRLAWRKPGPLREEAAALWQEVHSAEDVGPSRHYTGNTAASGSLSISEKN